MIIILCNVFATLNLPGDLIVRIQFYLQCHLHENTTNQLHQKVLLLMKSKCTSFSSNKAFSAKTVLQPTVRNCRYVQNYRYMIIKSVPFLFFPFPQEKKKKKKVYFSKRQKKTSAQICLVPILGLIYGTSSQSLCAK